MTVIPVDSIVIPDRFVMLASGWYDGSGDMLYAVASTGGLTMGSIRPLGADTPEKWYLSIWRDLSVDIGYAVRAAKRSGHEDYEALSEFEDWVDAQVDALVESYSLEDWDDCYGE